MKAYFSRRTPYYVMGAAEMGDSDAFDAYPVTVDPVVLANVRALRRLVIATEESFIEHSAPEECAQLECDEFSAGIRLIMKTRAQDNING